MPKKNTDNIASLCSVADLLMGQSPPGETYNKEGKGYPLLNGPTEFGLDHPTPCLWTTAPTKICEKGDLLFCVRGTTTGRMNWADQSYCIGRGLCAIRAKTGFLDTNYIYYTLIDELSRLLTLCSGSVFLNLSRSDLEQFEIRWSPDSQERAKNASILKGIDDKIKLNQAINKTLEAIGQAVFKRWFVDFEFPNQEGKPYKTSGGEMVDTELGKIPKGWQVDRLGNRATVKGRIGWKGLQVSEYVSEGPRIVGGTQLIDFHVNWAVCPHITNERYDESPEIMLKPTDILMTKDGTIGKLAYVDELIEPATVASGIFVIRSNSSAINQMYLFNYFKSDIFDNLVESRIEGSVVPHLYQRDIENMLMVVPVDQISRQFEEMLSTFQRKIDLSSKSSIILRKIRDYLLPRLMSGKIRAPVIKEKVETVANA